MGNEESFQEIGSKANQQSPNSFINSSVINLTNATIIGQSQTDPENDYKKMNKLGQGTYGTVYEAKHRITDIVRAMKIVKKHTKRSKEEEKEILNEENILKTMDHPNIVKIFEFYSNDENYSIIMENCKGGSLFKEISLNGPFNEDYASYVMYENILIANKNKSNNFPNIKICDFGMSKIVEKQASQNSVVGSLYYVAPEVLNKNYNEKCDLWSCGVIMYFILSKRFPFTGTFNDEIINKIKVGEFDTKAPPLDKLF